MWQKFEETLKNAGNIEFWWRDDDIMVEKRAYKLHYLKYKFKVKSLMKLYATYKIPAIWAIVPHNYEKYGQYFTKNILKYEQFATIHGIYHMNKATTPPSTEFPETCNLEENFQTITQYYNSFKPLFKDNLLPVFVPPFNNMNTNLKERLIKYGLIISEYNFNQNNHSNYNVDYDFANWETHKLKAENLILKELTELITSGIKTLGLNSHHTIIDKENYKFYEKLFKTISKCNNVKWVNPFLLF